MRILLRLIGFVILVIVVLALLGVISLSALFGGDADGREDDAQRGNGNVVDVPNDGSESTDYDHPLLNEDSERTLTAAGVDIRTLPTSVSGEQEACAIEALGQERVNAIKDGATVTEDDYEKAKGCLSDEPR